MNERIRELADEAAKFSAIMALPTGESGDKLFVEKLAELIVRECMLCSDSLAKHYINTHPEKEQVWLLAAIADYSSEIEKHFGVNHETQ